MDKAAWQDPEATSSSAEIFSSDLNEVVSSIGKVVEVCEVSTTHVAESADSSTTSASTHEIEGREG